MNNVQEKKGLSTGAKWGIGCGSGCLVVMVVLVVLGFAGYSFIKGKVGAWQEEFAALGFEDVVTGQQITVNEDVTAPTLYMAQGVKIVSDVSTNVAVIGQMAEVHARVGGDLYFRGQMLILGPDAVIEGDVDVMAQLVQNDGRVLGEIRGSYQAMPVQEVEPEPMPE